ncbi:reverse transcriptase domain, reverse transcriptase zinc-binding domain protein, partial [Tanacetum coccineum]
SRGGRGVKEKRSNVSNIEVVTDGVAPSITGDFGNAAMEETTLDGNAPGKSSYANVTGKPSGTKVNFHTLFTLRGNRIDVVVSVESITTISKRFVNIAYGFFLGKRVAYPVVANYVRNTWGKYGLVRSMFSSSTWLFSFQFSSMEGLNAMLENGPWSSYARAMIELRADVELKDNIVAAMPKINREGYYTCTGETMNMKKTSQIPKAFLVGQKIGFKPKQGYQPVSKKTTANTSANKKKNVDPPKEVTNPFEVLTSVENDEDTSTKIDSEVEVALDNNELASFLAKKDGYGIQSLLEQWKDSHELDDYKYDPYDDDMYDRSLKFPKMAEMFTETILRYFWEH